MGYQLPGLGNVAFPGFGALGKQQARDTTRQKKGKDKRCQVISRSASTPSSPSSTLPALAARPSCEGKLLEKGFLQRLRQELRPLLNSIRFLEACNRESFNDGASRIGPFQITRDYHQDAWKHSPPMAWSRCRDLNHSENTVIAYWLKYCPEAVEKHDFETLAKIHKGTFSADACWSQENLVTFEYFMSLPSYGIRGMGKEEENCYWKRISQHLKQQRTAGIKKENVTWNFFTNEKNAKQDGSSKSNKKRTPVLSPINTNTLASSCVTPTKQQLPLIQTLRPKFFRRAPTDEKKAVISAPNGGARIGSARNNCKKSVNKRPRQTSSHQLNNVLKPNSLGHAISLRVCCQLSRSERTEMAAIYVQALWRMRCARDKYVRLRNAAILIQKRWRKHGCVFPCGQTIQSRQGKHLDRNSSFCVRATPFVANQAGFKGTSGSSPYVKTPPICVGNQGGFVGPGGSPCELLYRTDISPNQEDELLSELVNLLNLNAQSPSVESCHSFRFPHSSEELIEACTPKMQPDLRDSFVEFSGLSAETKAEEPHCLSLSCVESTPLAIKQALLSPLMEKEIIAELAKLFPPCKGSTQEDAPSASLSLTSSGQLLKPTVAKENVSQEQHGKEGIIRRLTFNTLGVEEDKMIFETAAVANVNVLERQTGTCLSQGSTPSSSEHISSNSKRYEEELHDISIPLLVDQSPVLTSKRRIRCQNPLNRKIEKALVSSLSDWHYSLSSDEDKEELGAFGEGVQAVFRVDLPSSLSCTESTASKEFFLSSLTESSSIQIKASEFARLTEDTGEVECCKKSHVLVDAHPDCLLETCDVRNSTIYAKAIFQCPQFSLDDHGQGVLHEASCSAARCRSSGGFPPTSSITRAVLLRRLCMLWDVHKVDLLTRSLKFKGLKAVQCQCQQGNVSLQDADDVTDIQLEINHLEALPEKPDEESRRRDLLIHQRDVIYTNIAAFCDMQERQHLYEKWEIQKVLTGRLKKMVYELLWIDPRRYQESAELVIQYL